MFAKDTFGDNKDYFSYCLIYFFVLLCNQYSKYLL